MAHKMRRLWQRGAQWISTRRSNISRRLCSSLNTAKLRRSQWSPYYLAILGVGLVSGIGFVTIYKSEQPKASPSARGNRFKSSAQIGADERVSVRTRENDPRVLFRFGVIADVQHADIKDGTNYDGTEFRYYRGALDQLKVAISWWNKVTPDIQFIAQLGDLIDGQNAGKYGEGKNFPESQSDPALKRVLEKFEGCVCKAVHHAIGNHELYNFNRNDLFSHLFESHQSNSKMISPSSPERLYHSFCPHEGWRVLLLDAYDISIQGRNENTREYKRARDLLRANNPDCLVPGKEWFSVPRPKQRFVPYNGAIGDDQFKWLADQLREAKENEERVVILSHIPLNPRASSLKTTLWNYPEVLSLINSSKTVALVLAGHHHRGGYVHEEGCHHLTVEGTLTHKDGAYGVVEVRSDTIYIHGRGDLKDQCLELS